MFDYNLKEFTHIPSNNEIQELRNISEIVTINEGEILCFENSDIAFHLDTILNSLDKTDITEILHKSPYDTDNKWKPKEVKMMYLMTKTINNNIIKLLKQPIPRFIAISVTGLGGSIIEPGVLKYNESFNQIEKTIKLGLDPNDIVIRIDPLYPGINTPDVNSELIENIIKRTYDLGIKQIYSSVFDIYNKTPNKLLELIDISVYENGIEIDNCLHADKKYLTHIFSILDEMIYKISNGTIEHILCGEHPSVIPLHSKRIGCLNFKRIEQTICRKIIGIKDRTELDKNIQRENCRCVITTNNKKVKRQGLAENHKCQHNCIGCYVGNFGNTKKWNENDLNLEI